MQIFPDSVGGTMNAYTLFYQACREEHKNRFPDESVKGYGFKVFKLYCATPRSLKGEVSRDVSVYSLMVFKVFHKLFTTLYNYPLLFFFRNYLLILKMLTETLVRISFFVIGRCSLVLTTRWLKGKFSRIYLSLADFGMILQNHRRLPESIFSVEPSIKYSSRDTIL
jgi:hypothetical protein